MKWSRVIAAAPVVGLAGLALHDLVQRKHALLRNYPVVGHLRYVLEEIGPELRQYIVTDNDSERPFSRDQRRWIYASAKQENNYFGFGTDNDLDRAENYPVIKQRTFSDVPVHRAGPSGGAADDHWLPSAKILGAHRQRAHRFRPDSVINVSAMSFGSLSGPAIRAINGGVKLAGCLHNTGEGGLSTHHRQGGDLVLQVGTAYFGCRGADGGFDLGKLIEVVDTAPVKAIEIKLSQGAKPGLGGLLPGAKVSPEIADIRGIAVGEDCVSPSRHTAFHDVDSMLDVVEQIAQATGRPVGIKSAVGDLGFWRELVALMGSGERGVDFITIDGGEGGTGAAPRVFSDSVSLPFRVGFPRVYALFAEAGLTDRVTFIGSGRLGLPESSMIGFAMGCDMINVAREAMLSIGCIQAQKCHTDRCPTGVTTQNPWLNHGLDRQLKAVRLANYVQTLRGELIKLVEAVGVAHPALVTVDDIELLDAGAQSRSLREVYGYRSGWGVPAAADCAAVAALMDRTDSGEGTVPVVHS